MCFDRNINGNRDVKYLGCDYLFACAMVRETHFNTYHVSVYKTLKEASEKHSDVDVLVNFASLRSAYDVTLEAIKIDQLRTIAIIAEGIPENMTRTLNKKAKDKGVIIIGPATVGGIKPGCFRIGNTGGMMDNIIRCKLYRPGNVAYVSRSGIFKRLLFLTFPACF